MTFARLPIPFSSSRRLPRMCYAKWTARLVRTNPVALRILLLVFAGALAMGTSLHAQAQHADGAAVNSRAAAAGARRLTSEDLQAWLDGFFPYALQRNDIAGAVVLVVKDGKILLEKGYGYSDLAEQKP